MKTRSQRDATAIWFPGKVLAAIGVRKRLSTKALRDDIAARGPCFQKMTSIFQESRLPGLKRHFDSLKLSTSGQIAALSALAKELHPAAPLLAIDAAREAHKLDPKPFRAKWLAFRLFEQGLLAEAVTLLTTDASSGPFSESEKNRAEEILSKFESIQNNRKPADGKPPGSARVRLSFRRPSPEPGKELYFGQILGEIDQAVSDGLLEAALIRLLQLDSEGCAGAAPRLFALGLALTRDPYLSARLIRMLDGNIPPGYDARQAPAGLGLPACYDSKVIGRATNAGAARLLALHLLERCLARPEGLPAASPKATLVYLLRSPDAAGETFLARAKDLAQSGHRVILFTSAEVDGREKNIRPIPPAFEDFRAQLLAVLNDASRTAPVVFSASPLELRPSVLDYLFLDDAAILPLAAHPRCDHFMAAGAAGYNVPQARLIPGAFAARNRESLEEALRPIKSFEQIECWMPESLRSPVPVREETEAGNPSVFVLVCPEGAAASMQRRPLVFPPNTRLVELPAPMPDARSLADRIAEEVPAHDTAVAFYDTQLAYAGDHFLRAYDLHRRRGGGEAVSFLPVRYSHHERCLEILTNRRASSSYVIPTAAAIFDLEFLRSHCAFATKAIVIADKPVFVRCESTAFYEQNKKSIDSMLSAAKSDPSFHGVRRGNDDAPRAECPPGASSHSGLELLRRHRLRERRRLFQLISVWRSGGGQALCGGLRSIDGIFETIANHEKLTRILEDVAPEEFLTLFRFVFENPHYLKALKPEIQALFLRAGSELGLQPEMAPTVIRAAADITRAGHEAIIPAFEVIVSGAGERDFAIVFRNVCSTLPLLTGRAIFRLSDLLRRYGGNGEVIAFLNALGKSESRHLLDDHGIRAHIGEALLFNAERSTAAEDLSPWRAEDFTMFAPVFMLLGRLILRGRRDDFLQLLERSVEHLAERRQIFDSLRDYSEAIAALQVGSTGFPYEILDKRSALRLAILLNDKAQIELEQRAADILGNRSHDDFLACERLGNCAPINEWFQKKCAGVGAVPVDFGAGSLAGFFESVLNARPDRSVSEGPMASVVMTVFNPDIPLMELAVQSILRQTYRNIELIIVDDGSDASVFEEIAARFGGLPAVRILRSEENNGPYVGRNRAIAEANGKYLAIQDADDCSHPERIELQVNLLEREPEVQMATCEHMRLDQSGRIQFEKDFKLSGDGTMSSVFRLDVLRQLEGFCRVRSRGDVEMRERIRYLFGPRSVAHMECPLVFCGASPASLSKTTSRNYHGFLQLFRANFESRLSPRITSHSSGKPPAIPWPLRPEFAPTGESA